MTYYYGESDVSNWIDAMVQDRNNKISKIYCQLTTVYTLFWNLLHHFDGLLRWYSNIDNLNE